MLASLLMLAGLLPGVSQAQVPAWQAAILAPAGNSAVLATAADGSGNLYLTGYFLGTVNFGTLPVSATNTQDMFVAKWSLSTQQFAWVQHTGSAGVTKGLALAVSGNLVYVAGNFAQTVAFGSTSLTAVGMASNGFVAALTASGTFAWANALTDPGNTEAAALAVSGTSIYVAGFFASSLTLGSLLLTSPVNYGRVCFVAKLTEAGASTTFTWAKAAGGNTYSQGMALAANGPVVYVGGNYAGLTTTFDALVLPANPNGVLNGFVARLLDTGSTASFTWAQVINCRTYTLVRSLAVSGPAVYLGGTTGNNAQFGSLTVAALSSDSGFVARLTDSGATGSFAWANSITNGYGCEVDAVAVSGQQVYVAGSYGNTLTFGPTTLTAIGYSVFVARLLDSGASSAYLWAATSVASGGSGTTTSLVLSGTQACVAGYAIAPLAFGTTTLSPINYNGTGFLAVLSNAVPLANMPSVTGPILTLCPNPAASGALVNGAIPHTSGQVLDALGRCVATFTTDATGAAQVQAGLAPGVYVVRAGASAARLVVE